MGGHEGAGVLPEQFETWYRLHARDIFVYASRRVGASAAEDICAQTFCEAWDHLDSFDSTRGSARPWLFGIANNLVRGHQRGESRRLAAYSKAGVAAPSVSGKFDDVDAAIEAEAGWRAIASRMRSLRSRERDVVWLAAAGLTRLSRSSWKLRWRSPA